MSGAELEDPTILSSPADFDVVPTRRMVKHKAQSAISKRLKRGGISQRRSRRRAAAAQASAGDDDDTE